MASFSSPEHFATFSLSPEAFNFSIMNDQATLPFANGPAAPVFPAQYNIPANHHQRAPFPMPHQQSPYAAAYQYLTATPPTQHARPAQPAPRATLALPSLHTTVLFGDKHASRVVRTTTHPSQQFSTWLSLTLRTVKTPNNTAAYARSYWPKPLLPAYLHAPAHNPAHPHDKTAFNPSPYGLAANSHFNVPLPIAWIDERRITIPHPRTLRPGHLLDSHGNPVRGINGDPLRDLALLPRTISSAVEGWRLHFWLSMDPRITLADIVSRMHFRCSATGGEGPLAGGLSAVTATLQSRLDAFRRDNGILAPLSTNFDAETYEVTPADVEAVSRLSDLQMEYGTWWVVDEQAGVMYQGEPAGGHPGWRREAFVLPGKAGKSMRVQCILEHIERLRGGEQGGVRSAAEMAYASPVSQAGSVPVVCVLDTGSQSGVVKELRSRKRVAEEEGVAVSRKHGRPRTVVGEVVQEPLMNAEDMRLLQEFNSMATPEGSRKDVFESPGGRRQLEAFQKRRRMGQ